MRRIVIPGVRQDHAGQRYMVAFNANQYGDQVGKEILLPYIEKRTIEYMPGSMDKCTDYFVITNVDGARSIL